jgi:putative component of toxin-antitoxin plasmid stabilization module
LIGFKKDDEVIILLVGGDKSTQSDDIKKAREILKELDDDKSI